MRSRRTVRLLYFTREAFPTFRVDIDVLFGRELIRRGHEIDFVMQAADTATPTGPIPWRSRIVWCGPTSVAHGWIGRAARFVKGFMHDVACLIRLARKDRYDIIQVRNKFVIGSLASMVARARGLKFVFWLSFPVPEAQLAQARTGTARFPLINLVRGRVFDWLLYGFILPRCDHAFVQSERMKDSLCERGADPSKLTPVPMGIDLDEWHSSAALVESVPLENRCLTLGYLGTLGAQRRLEILVDALQLIVQQGVDAKLLLVGGSDRGDDVAQLVKRAQQLGIADRIQVTGFLPRADALERFRGVDIALSPIVPTAVLNLGSPTKMIEYMALGIPIVANKHPEQLAMLRQSRAGLCVSWSPRQFARACIRLARAGVSKRMEIGRRGRRWAFANRGYSAIADSVEAQYLNIIGSVQAHSPNAPDDPSR